MSGSQDQVEEEAVLDFLHVLHGALLLPFHTFHRPA